MNKSKSNGSYVVWIVNLFTNKRMMMCSALAVCCAQGLIAKRNSININLKVYFL